MPIVPKPEDDGVPPQVNRVLETFGHVGGGKSFAPVSGAVQDMIESIEPVIATFDKLLVSLAPPFSSCTLPTLINGGAGSLTYFPLVFLPKVEPYLSRYQANLDTVPSSSSGVKLEWRQLSALPSGFGLPAPVSNHGIRDYCPGVHISPLAGHLWISNGRSVWRREHRAAEDDGLAVAVDDYSKVYHNVREKVGDTVLSEAGAPLRNIVPFFEVTPSG